MKTIPKSWMGILLLGLMIWPQNALAVEREGRGRIVLKSVDVVGTKEDIKDIAASAHLIETQDIRKHSYDNIDRLLRKIPGVYTREEDGNGLFPNISIRGVDPGRSAKVTIMEDGVLMAPAPYSAPAAYFSPTAGRMSSIEVLKGSSQVRYGPHTTGGVINYKATSIPEMQSAYSKTLFGSFGELRNHTHFGNTIETSSGRFGYVIENYYRENNGFREIQPAGDFRTGGDNDTGIENLEPMVKLMFEPNSSRYQRFEIKFGYTERDANETYLGQTEAEFREHPFRRLAATRFDQFDSEQFRAHVRHFLELTPNTNIVTTAYGTSFFRNWQKLHNCEESGLAIPTTLSQCLKDPNGDALLKGMGPGAWTLRNNNRTYYTYGVESQMTHQKNIGATQHTFHAGVRYHYDQIRRKQWEETFTQDANGFIIDRQVGLKGSQANRRQKTTALAFNVDDQIKWNNWTFKPGVRYEHLWQHFQDFRPGNEADRKRNYGVWAAGGSLDYRFNEATNAFVGVHRGFSVASPNGATKKGDEQVDEETSIGYEVGVRYDRPDQGFRTELIGFWTDLDDLVVGDIVGASGVNTGTTRNVGDIRSKGIEFMVQYDPSIRNQWSVRNPWYFTLTYTNAEFTSDVSSADTGDIFVGARDGNEVPNIPEIQFAVGTALAWQKWSLNLDGQYIDSSFATGSNVVNEINTSGVGDVRFGENDGVFLLDVSLAHQLNENVRLFTNFRNVTDAVYLASRQPQGPRAGAPFQAFGGIEITY